ncbi:hypothetical protein DYI37_11960 [Fulvimarina endophytica]|uniref:Antifreeze protein n=1 Tax=Fulvimarina endophytica TaxID=2293836 RepID=A0A371X3A3_9HYPH|nr:hypothetical protein [Fulvimarina endophytica]RFC63706.1 hypothetical protein DYI37_11960 [Fulvimarina endophytica]
MTFSTMIRNACLAAAVAAATLGASLAPAAADSVRFGVTIGNGPVVVDSRHGGWERGDRGRHHRRDARRDRGCSPREAVHKAARIGVRHARVVRANGRSIAVAGRLGGERTVVRFADRRGCPVERVRSR